MTANNRVSTRSRLDNRTCQNCGIDFLPFHGNQKNCTPECRKKLQLVRHHERYSPAKPKTKECVVCGDEFESHQPKARFCSEWCQRHEFGPFLCKVCGTEFRSSNSGSTCCSVKCATRNAGRHSPTHNLGNCIGRPLIPQSLKDERDVYRRWGKRTKRFRRYELAQINRLRMEVRLRTYKPCKQCGELFNPFKSRRVNYCSFRCADVIRKRYDRQKAKVKNRLKGGEWKVNVVAHKVFQRDGYRCQLCGIKTLRKWKLHPKAPELDHIIPLAKGGDHSYENTQCACRKCNGDKSDKEYGQLRLVGGVI